MARTKAIEEVRVEVNTDEFKEIWPRLYHEFRRCGVVETITLYEGRRNAQVYRYEDGSLKQAYGDRNLFNEWMREQERKRREEEARTAAELAQNPDYQLAMKYRDLVVDMIKMLEQEKDIRDVKLFGYKALANIDFGEGR